MHVSVFGLGYVGTVSAACLAADGHTVVGVDVNADKAASIEGGRSPIVEQGLDELIRAGRDSGRLRATTDTTEAVWTSDLSLICVGTPSRRNGSLDLAYLERVCAQIGEALAAKDAYHVVVVRSTVLPGTTRDVVIPTLERASGRSHGSGFGVAVNPEFLREGTAVHDFRHPPMTLVGHNYQSDARRTEALYTAIEAPLVSTSIRTAEMIKYASNTWHALKVCFANEIGNLCKRLDIDSHEVMDIFCRDEKLNLSSYYLKPGFAFGGSCLPKDVRAMQYRAKDVDSASRRSTRASAGSSRRLPASQLPVTPGSNEERRGRARQDEQVRKREARHEGAQVAGHVHRAADDAGVAAADVDAEGPRRRQRHVGPEDRDGERAIVSPT
jgi:GDP-mannose 6-dehydrogenase